MAMVLSMTACSSSSSSDDDADDDTEAAAEAEDTEDTEETVYGDVNGDGQIIVGYISKNLTDTFHAPINALAQETFDALVADGTIDSWTGILDGDTDPSTQIDCANDCITMGCDFVFILPAESDASDPAVTAMVDAGIKVIVVNSETTSTRDVAWLLSISDDVQAGELMAEYVNEQCPDGGYYLHCQGVIGNSAQIDRGTGIANAINDNLILYGEYACDWEGDKAVDAIMDALATEYADEIVAVICDNDDMSSSVQTYVNSVGRSDIICIGVDGNSTPLEMIANGELQCTILQDGTGQLQAGIDAMLAYIEDGTEPESNVNIIDFVTVTIDNVDEYL